MLHINVKKELSIEQLATLDDNELLIILDGNIEKQFYLARYFQENKNEKRAVYWYRHAAEKGNDVYSQYNLAICYQNGQGVEKNENEAFKWYKKAADQNYAHAQGAVGISYYNGYGIEKNSNEAFSWFEKGSKNGDIKSQHMLGVCYGNGVGVERNEKKAVQFFINTAMKNFPDSQFELGRCFSKGRGVEKDPGKAVRWYTKAAEQGHTQSQLELGKCLLRGEGIKKDEYAAFLYFQQAAVKGCSDSQVQLGICYEKGLGIKKDENKAFALYDQAAQQGNADAKIKLGFFYEKGICVAKNEKIAVEWYIKAAEQGHEIAQGNLGNCYRLGIGLIKDQKKAIEWYIKAAEKGNQYAQVNLGKCLMLGNGVDKNEDEAAIWFKKAAEQGDPFSKNWLDRKISYDANFILEQTANSKDCHVPIKPPPRISQFGPYCGLAAFAAVLNNSGHIPFPIYATEADKIKAGEVVDDEKKDILLHQLKYKIDIKDKWRTEEGEIFNVKIFLQLAKHYGIEGCEAIIKENCTQDEYQTPILEAINKNKMLIVACDSDYGMPVNEQGNHVHWVYSDAYWYDFNNILHINAIHQDIYADWQMDNLYKNNNQIKIENPFKKDGHLKKFRHALFIMPRAKELKPDEVVIKKSMNLTTSV